MTRTRPCLYCRSPLEHPLRASNPCPSCGEINLREDLRLFRTRRRGPRLLEAFLKGLSSVLLAGFALMIMTNGQGQGGYAGSGFAIGTPILGAVIAWDTLGLITRRHSMLRMEVFWPALLAAVVLGPLAMFFVLGVGVSRLSDSMHSIGMLLVAGTALLFAARIWRKTRTGSRTESEQRD